jgi:dienelactone hydrolase
MTSTTDHHSCCPPGSEPYTNQPEDYEFKGSVQDIGNLDTYFVGPKSSKSAIVLICDVFGLHSGLHKVIADNLALELDILVAIPDLFHGDPPFTENRPVQEAFGKAFETCLFHHIESDLTQRLFPYLKETLGVEKIGMIAFCYGMYIATHLLPSGLIHAAASPHPSIYTFMNKLNEDPTLFFKTSKCPVMLLNSGNDPVEQGPHGALHEAILQTQYGSDSVFESFPDMKHGWSVRGESTPEIVRDRKRVMQLYLEFFRAHLLSA